MDEDQRKRSGGDSAVGANSDESEADSLCERLSQPEASDAPLEDPVDDRLGRSEMAGRLAAAILSLDSSRGFVLGLQGAWGTGKTTLMNFIRRDLDDQSGDSPPITMLFNPWWFGSSQDVLLNFFHELSATIGRSNPTEGLRRIASLVGVMGKIATPLSCIPALGAAAGVLGQASTGLHDAAETLAGLYEKDLLSVRRELEEALKSEQRRIVVFVDDLDRLNAVELKQMLAIVKAIANLPNVVYVLALDRTRASAILKSAEEPDGAAYLDKVIQMSVEVPIPTPLEMQSILDERLLDIMEMEIDDPQERDRLVELYMTVLQPMIRTPRDTSRFLNAVGFAYPGIRDDVNGLDFLALEAVHLFAPEVYNHVRSNQALYAGITKDDALGDLADGEQRKPIYDQAIGLAGQSVRPPVRKALELVFPKVAVTADKMNYGTGFLEQWAREKRACSPDIFPVYFSFVVPYGHFSEAQYQALMATTGNAAEFAEALCGLASKPHWAGRGRTRLAVAMEMLAQHDETGFAPLDAYEALLGLANASDALDVPSDASVMGLYTNERRAWHLASSVLKRSEDPATLLARVVTNAKSPVAPLGWLHSCDIIAEAVAEGQAPERDLVMTGEAVDQVKPVAIERLHQLAEQGTLHHLADFGEVLDQWHRWEPEGAARYVRELIQDGQGLSAFLLTKLRRLEPRTRHPEPVIKREVDRILDSFERFVDLSTLQSRAREVLGEATDVSPQAQDALTIVADWKLGDSEGNGVAETGSGANTDTDTSG